MAASSSSSSSIVWEAHISELMRQDSRWRPLWSTLLKACTIPDAATTTFPGHASQRDTKPGCAHQEELARCKQDPHPLADGLSELRQRVFGLGRVGSSSTGRRRGRSTSSSASISSSPSASASQSGGAGGDGDGDSGWVLQRGRFVWRDARGPDAEGAYSEEAYIRDLLATILLNTGGGNSSKGVRPRGFAYVPPNGFRAWERGSLDPTDSWRLMILHNIPANRSQFRYRHPTTGQTHALPDADGTVRLVRTGAWHCATSEDSHLWCLEFQLGPDAGRALRDRLRPVSPTGTTAPPQSPTPLAVALLFGRHRRHPLPHESRKQAQQAASSSWSQIPTSDGDRSQHRQQQQQGGEEEGGGGGEAWGPLDGVGSRPTSASYKRGSRGRKASIDPLTGKWAETEEGKAGCGAGEGEEGSYYHSLRNYDGASSLASSCASSVASWDSGGGGERDGVCCWVRTGELSSGGEDGDELDDVESAFCEVGLEGNEGVGVHGA